MGGSQSVSHFAHHKSGGHRFKRVESKDLNTNVPCRMCWKEIKTGVAAYRCQRCVSGFFIHDVCFHRKQTIESHWAHPSHPLTLSSLTGAGHLQNQQAGVSSDDHHVVCTLCAGALDPKAFAYVCSGDDGHDCHGFSAHPSCCVDVSRTFLDLKWHEHELTLLSPPHDQRRSPCLKCGKKRLRTTAPWSYQCTSCNVHLCLPCRIQGEEGEGNGANKKPWYGKDLVIEIFGCMGDAMGTFGRRFTCACLGN